MIIVFKDNTKTIQNASVGVYFSVRVLIYDKTQLNNIAVVRHSANISNIS